MEISFVYCQFKWNYPNALMYLPRKCLLLYWCVCWDFFYRSVSYTRAQWILNPQPHPPGPPPILVEERSVIWTRIHWHKVKWDFLTEIALYLETDCCFFLNFRSNKLNNEVKKRGGGFTKLCGLSPQLQEFLGASEMARTEVH